MKTKILSLILALVMVAAITPSVASTVAAALTEDFSETELQYAANVAAAIENREETYAFPVHITTESLSRIMHIVHYEYPLLFCIDTGYSYYYGVDSSGDIYVTKVVFYYNMTSDEYSSALAEVEQWMDGIMSMTDSSFSDSDFALFFHDYLCTNYKYDTDYKIHNLYEFIKNRKGVCEAYTLAYSALLGNAGVDSSFAVSDDMNHAWNLVSIDGEWYHADVTWDDPVGLVPGMARHTYFLKSDAAISSDELGHYSWISPYICDSTDYDDSVIGDATSPFAYSGGMWYYMYNNDLYVTDSPEVSGKLYKNLNLYWYVWGETSRYYVGYFGGLIAHDGHLYLNSCDSIIEIDTADGSMSEIYNYTDGDGYIYGFTMDPGDDGVSYSDYSSGYATLNISTEPGEAIKTVAVQLFEAETVISGDANGDEILTIADISYMFRALASGAVLSPGADVNGDGKVSAADISVLTRILSGGAG